MNPMFHPKSFSHSLLIVFFLLALASCKKETIEEPHQYPDELTIHNVEEFVDAPQEVIDELERNERLALAEHNPYSVDPPEDRHPHSCPTGTLHEGSLVAYDGTWRHMPNALVIYNTYSGLSISTTDPLNYRFISLGSTSGPVYYSFMVNTDIRNGVTPMDKLLILRHINGTQPFNSYLQLCAADVDRNNVIDTDDADLVEDAILGQIDAFPPFNGNVFITSKDFYESRRTDWVNTGTFQNVAGNAIPGPDFIAVKRGDVNATFNF